LTEQLKCNEIFPTNKSDAYFLAPTFTPSWQPQCYALSTQPCNEIYFIMLIATIEHSCYDKYNVINVTATTQLPLNQNYYKKNNNIT